MYEEWLEKTGKPMLDGIGATEMLHIFISNRFGDSRPACTGKPVSGYEARIVDDDMQEVPRGTVGRLAVRGPTGCRYIADSARRTMSVTDGTSPATPSCRTRTATSTSPPAPTT